MRCCPHELRNPLAPIRLAIAVIESQQAGFDSHLTKPVDADTLAQLLASFQAR